MGRPILDVAFVTNMRDEIDRKRFLGKWHPPSGHCIGPSCYLGDIMGRTLVIDSLTEDLLSSHGRKKAKGQFISAVQRAQQSGAKVILLV